MLFDRRDLESLHLTGRCRHLLLSVLEWFQSPMFSAKTLGPLVYPNEALHLGRKCHVLLRSQKPLQP